MVLRQDKMCGSYTGGLDKIYALHRREKNHQFTKVFRDLVVRDMPSKVKVRLLHVISTTTKKEAQHVVAPVGSGGKTCHT